MTKRPSEADAPTRCARGCNRPSLRRRRTLLEEHLQQQLARVLRIDSQTIDPLRPLKELGFDSLMALEFRNRLELTLGLTLPATLIWGHPTLAALDPHLASQMGLPLVEAQAAAAADGDSRAMKTALSGLDEHVGRSRPGRARERGHEGENCAHVVGQTRVMARNMRQNIEGFDLVHAEPIAIVGMACRFPGGAQIRTLTGRCEEWCRRVTEVPQDRWNSEQYYSPIPMLQARRMRDMQPSSNASTVSMRNSSASRRAKR
jgi:acyl carrier protein